jgi:cyclin-dependent kinase
MAEKLAKYKALKEVGQGVYGVVYKAINTETEEIVAIKKVKLESEQEGVPATTIREIVLLKELKHENIVKLLDQSMTEDIIILIFEYWDQDLSNYMAKHCKNGIDIQAIKSIMRQILKGVKHWHQHKVLHRDLKPQNILYTDEGVAKVADFGLSRAFGIPFKYYPQTVVTLWYRPPEILLGSTSYTTAIDIWSVGCIFAELFTNKVFFETKSEDEQLDKIYSILGTPTLEEWPEMAQYPKYEEIKESVPKQNISELIENIDDEAWDLLEKMLKINPNERITAAEALKHNFLIEFLDEE